MGIDVNKRLIMVAPSPCDKKIVHNKSNTVVMYQTGLVYSGRAHQQFDLCLTVQALRRLHSTIKELFDHAFIPSCPTITGLRWMRNTKEGWESRLVIS